jgi:hypothetical protein
MTGYRNLLNSVGLWEKPINGKKQIRIIPHYTPDSIGEPVMTLDKTYLPIQPRDEAKPNRKNALYSNLLNIDGYTSETGWTKIDTKTLAPTHIPRLRNIQRITSNTRSKYRPANKAQRGASSKPNTYKLRINRQLNTTTNPYQKMNENPHEKNLLETDTPTPMVCYTLTKPSGKPRSTGE